MVRLCLWCCRLVKLEEARDKLQEALSQAEKQLAGSEARVVLLQAGVEKSEGRVATLELQLKTRAGPASGWMLVYPKGEYSVGFPTAKFAHGCRKVQTGILPSGVYIHLYVCIRLVGSYGIVTTTRALSSAYHDYALQHLGREIVDIRPTGCWSVSQTLCMHTKHAYVYTRVRTDCLG